MKHQKGSRAYNQTFHGNGTARAIRISRDPRSVATRPLWLVDVVQTAQKMARFAA